jgi:hypothetical protein
LDVGFYKVYQEYNQLANKTVAYKSGEIREKEE